VEVESLEKSLGHRMIECLRNQEICDDLELGETTLKKKNTAHSEQ
jgi:hypothetical protein